MTHTGIVASTVEQPGSRGLWRVAARRLVRNPSAMVGLVIILGFIVVATFAPVLAPYEPRAQNLALVADGCCQGPSAAHWMGSDYLGRDVLSRLIYGARTSLVIALTSIGFGAGCGILLAILAAYVRRLDGLLMRLIDILLTVPGFFMAIGIAAIFGPGVISVAIAIGAYNVPIFARLLRGSLLAQENKDYVLSARAAGATRLRILLSHMMPNALSPVIVAITLAFATSIVDAAGLGFLGLGPQDPSTPEWGTMLVDSVGFMNGAVFLVAFPGIAIALVVIGFNLFGDGVHEAIDPRLQGRG